MHKRCWILALILILSAVVSVAQTPDTPATREDILKLFDTMKIHEQMRLVMDSVLKQQRTMIHEAIRRHQPNVSEDELKHLDQFMTDIMKDMPVNELLDDMIPVYQKHLSKSDVGAMDAFYSSPTGQKLLREMPAMTAESMQAANPHMQAMMEKVMNRVEEEAQQEREKRGYPPKQDTVKN
jgi:uncharacterized protein